MDGTSDSETTIDQNARRNWALEATLGTREFVTLLATNFSSFEGIGTPVESGDWRKLKMSVENKRHTNAHQPFTSLSPTEVSIPPSPPQHKSSVNMRLFASCYYFLDDYYN